MRCEIVYFLLYFIMSWRNAKVLLNSPLLSIMNQGEHHLLLCAIVEGYI